MSKKNPQAILVIARKTLHKPYPLPAGYELIEKDKEVVIRKDGAPAARGLLKADDVFAKDRLGLQIVQPAENEELNKALLNSLVLMYEKTPAKYPAYVSLDPADLGLIQAASRLEFTPYLGISAHQSKEENEALWESITAALKEQA